MKERMGRRSSRRRHKMSSFGLLRGVLLLTAGGLLFAALWMLGDYVVQGRETRRVQQALQLELQQAQANATEIPAAPTPTQAPLIAAAADATAAPITPQPMPTFGAPILTDLVSIYSKNKDLVGWLKSDAIYDIDFPIVQRDNWHYVDHDFYGRSNIAGTVFLDEDNRIMPQDQNLVLHGHNMKNGTMFGKLVRLMDRNTMASEPLFTFSTLYHTQTYVPYAISLSSIDPAQQNYFNFLQPGFGDVSTLQSYTGWLQAHSALDLPVDVQDGDQLLTLVTCHGDEDSERLILGLRALRPGEDREAVLRQFALQVSKR